MVSRIPGSPICPNCNHKFSFSDLRGHRGGPISCPQCQIKVRYVINRAYMACALAVTLTVVFLPPFDLPGILELVVHLVIMVVCLLMVFWWFRVGFGRLVRADQKTALPSRSQ